MTCQKCNAPIPTISRGHPRTFCSNKCRLAAQKRWAGGGFKTWRNLNKEPETKK